MVSSCYRGFHFRYFLGGVGGGVDIYSMLSCFNLSAQLPVLSAPSES